MEEFYGSGIIFFNVIDTQEAAAVKLAFWLKKTGERVLVLHFARLAAIVHLRLRGRP